MIERLRRRLGPLAPPPPAGIGDDAARISRRGSRDWVWTADLLTEGVHFRRAWTEAIWLGRKALAVNLSDVAAMGAIPRSFLLTLALPRALELAWFDDFARGLGETALAARVTCGGGDTTASRGGIASGSPSWARRGGLLRRDASRPGRACLPAPWRLGAGLRLPRAGWLRRGRRGGGAARATRSRGGGAQAHLIRVPSRSDHGSPGAGSPVRRSTSATAWRGSPAPVQGLRRRGAVDLAAVPVHPAEARRGGGAPGRGLRSPVHGSRRKGEVVLSCGGSVGGPAGSARSSRQAPGSTASPPTAPRGRWRRPPSSTSRDGDPVDDDGKEDTSPANRAPARPAYLRLPAAHGCGVRAGDVPRLLPALGST